MLNRTQERPTSGIMRASQHIVSLTTYQINVLKLIKIAKEN